MNNINLEVSDCAASRLWVGTQLIIAFKLIRENDRHDEDDEAFKLCIKKLCCHNDTLKSMYENKNKTLHTIYNIHDTVCLKYI